MMHSDELMLRDMTENDYEQCIALWRRTPGMGLGASDTREAFDRFIARNPGLSFVAESEGVIVGTVMSGHDGRRGYIYHLAVDESFRRRRIGVRLVDCALEGLKKEKIVKCTLFVFGDNETGIAFWSGTGWYLRPDLQVRQMDL